jgi:hypothetical protein
MLRVLGSTVWLIFGANLVGTGIVSKVFLARQRLGAHGLDDGALFDLG